VNIPLRIQSSPLCTNLETNCFFVHQVYFQTKIRNLGKFWRVLQWKMLVYFMDNWSILRPFKISYGRLVYFPPFWYIVPRKIWQPCCPCRRKTRSCGCTGARRCGTRTRRRWQRCSSPSSGWTKTTRPGVYTFI
jgi:hypothetical protein